MNASPSGVSGNSELKKHLRTAPLARTLTALGTAAILATGATRAGDLTWEERLKAQEAIQRVYYSHQMGATLPFEEAYPRDLLATQVEDYLKKSAALETFWHTPVTAAALRGELERIAKSSHLPERLPEIYSVLDNNPLLIEECFARPSLVDRLIRSFFTTDQRVHAAEREQAEALRDRLIRGDVSYQDTDSHRVVSETRLAPQGESADLAGADSSNAHSRREDLERRVLTASEFRQWRSGLPGKVGEIGSVSDQPEAFEFQVILEEEPDRVRVATYLVAKKTWEIWWRESRNTFQEEAVRTVASTGDRIPAAPIGVDRSRGHSLVGKATGEIAPLAPDCLQGIWDNGSLDDIPEPRSQATAVWTGTLMIIWGGNNASSGSNSLNSGGRYDPLTDSWSPTSALNAPSPRINHTAIWTGSEMIIWGGWQAPGNFFYTLLDTGGRYNPLTDTWIPTSLGPLQRYRHTAVWTGTEMIIYGGIGVGGFPYRDGSRYSPQTDTWVGISASPTQYVDHTAVWTGTRMLVFGVSAPFQYDPSTDTWSALSTAGQPAARSKHTAIWTGSRMIIWGGFGANGSTLLNSGGQYDPATGIWTLTSTVNAPSARNLHQAVWTGSEMLIWGNSGLFPPTGGRYNPSADSWTAISTLNAPPSSSGELMAIWSGSRMIVWGGRASNTYSQAGGRYDPVTDSWTPTSIGNSPSAREDHSSIWTGSELIVWGGTNVYTTPNILNTGGRYNPLTDSWTATSTVNAPTGRYKHTAIWTGQLMIIWGGWDGSLLYTGWRYNPATDTWSPTSITNAPSGRTSFTAVWTGSRMIIWGGVDSSGQEVNTGGRYNPANDSWSTVTTTSAPTARKGHSAVWTGSRMVIWGGSFDPGTYPDLYLNTGGRYNPNNDSWAAVSTTNAPTPRSGHATVWTGTRMIVWGGSGLPTGGQYDPAADQWVPISSTGAPKQLFFSSTVWTGTEMVIWGGSSQNSGARYNPLTDTWRSTPLSGAPFPRNGHSAVWAGTYMIVWGGRLDTYLRSGGRLRFDILPDVDEDQDGATACGGDCNDANPLIHPGAVEVCNLFDDNCAGGFDEGFDADSDGYAYCADCDDSNAAVHPFAPDVCNHIDDNCNGNLDDGSPDTDGDSWASCIDCNDGNRDISPGATETCNGRDDDCDTVTDEGGDALCDINPTDCVNVTCGGASGCLGHDLPSGTPCDDANACTQSSTCNGTGFCAGSNPVVCTAPDDCHLPGACQSSTGLCINQNPKPNGTVCSDGNLCTTGEVCTSGICGGGVPKDADSDTYVDAACGGNDCNDSNSLVWLFPLEVTNLTMAVPADASWDSQAALVGPETIYDLTSGMLTGSGGLDTASATCLAPGTSSETYSDSRPDPVEGSGYWYLTRARNSCGIGTYGSASNATERLIPACP